MVCKKISPDTDTRWKIKKFQKRTMQSKFQNINIVLPDSFNSFNCLSLVPSLWDGPVKRGNVGVGGGV